MPSCAGPWCCYLRTLFSSDPRRKNPPGFGLVCGLGMGNARSDASTRLCRPACSKPRAVQLESAVPGLPRSVFLFHPMLSNNRRAYLRNRGAGTGAVAGVCRWPPLNYTSAGFCQPPTPKQTNGKPARREPGPRPRMFHLQPYQRPVGVELREIPRRHEKTELSEISYDRANTSLQRQTRPGRDGRPRRQRGSIERSSSPGTPRPGRATCRRRWWAPSPTSQRSRHRP